VKTFRLRVLVATCVLVALCLVQPGRAAAEAPVLGHLVTSTEAGPAHRHRALKPFRHPGGADALARSKAASEISAPSGLGGPRVPLAAGAALTGFDGIDESATLADPPDGAIAVGPTHVVEAVNDAVSIWVKTYDASGTLSAMTAAVSAADLNQFFGANPNCYTGANDLFGLVSDPSADYDVVNDRFLLEMISFDQLFVTSSLCIAVTQTGDPTGTWIIYAFPISPATSLLDFPRAVFGGDGQLYLSGNLFLCCDATGNLVFDRARVYAFKKNDLYAGRATTPQVVVVGNDPGTGLPADSLTPARSVGVAGMYFVSASNPSNPPLASSFITLWKWSDPFGSNVFAQQGHVAVAPYTQPPDAPQPGAFPLGITACTQSGATCITTNDARNLAANWFNGTVYGAHAIGCTQGGATAACVQWYQLGNLDAPPALLQQGIVADATNSGRHRYFPSLAVDQHGDVALAYAYSSATEYPGIAYATLSPSGPQGSEAVLKAGEATFVSTRYGDYAGTALDPHDGLTIWHVEEYAKGLAGTGEWGTWVSAIQIASATSAPDFSMAATPTSPPAIIPGAAESYTVTLDALNGFTGSVSLSVSGLPPGASASWSTTSVPLGTAPTTVTLTVTTANATTGGTYPLTITGTGGGLIHTAAVNLAVKDFSISVSPASRAVRRGRHTSYTVTLTAVHGFTGSVALTLNGLPAGARGSLSTKAVTFVAGGPTSAGITLAVSTTSTTPRGTSTLTITAAGEGVTRSGTCTLTVQ
jgi:hypothetical protein